MEFVYYGSYLLLVRLFQVAEFDVVLKVGEEALANPKFQQNRDVSISIAYSKLGKSEVMFQSSQV